MSIKLQNLANNKGFVTTPSKSGKIYAGYEPEDEDDDLDEDDEDSEEGEDEEDEMED